MKGEHGNHGGQIYQERRKMLPGKQQNGAQYISRLSQPPPIRNTTIGLRESLKTSNGMWLLKGFHASTHHRKRNKSSHHKKSPLGDESVPYGHREGYTWATTTANELMARWQGLPYIKHGDGRITITQPK